MKAENKIKKKFSFLKFSKRIFIVLLLFYVGICAFLFFFQEKLIFHPKPYSVDRYNELSKNFAERNFDELHFKMKDGTMISGWFIKDTSTKKSPLVIYYPGNAEEVSHFVEKKNKFPGCHLAVLNYRGYGSSEGSPTQDKLFSDALEIYDALKTRKDVDTSKIILYGRSLGTGVATYMCSKKNPAACILGTPYESVKAVSQEKYPFVPVSFLLKHPFNSVELAPQINVPALIIVCGKDKMIPPHHAYTLIQNWKGKKQVVFFKEADHKNVTQQEGYDDAIKNFILNQAKLK